MKLLGLDIGEKRIGVAKADTSVKIAIPLSTIEVDGTELDQISAIIKKEGIDAIVVGLPRNSAGEETAQSAVSRAFAAKLKKINPKVRFQDESLTSVLAENNLKKNKKSYTKADIDKEAAALILQDFIESFRPPSDASAKKKTTPMRKIFKVLLFLFIAFAVIVVFATSWYHSMLKPLDPHCGGGCATKQFTIASSESTDSIAKRLEEEELIKNSLALKIYLQINRLGGGLKAGMHELSSGQSVAEIVDILTDSPSAETFSLTFLPGGTLRDVRQRIIDAGYGEAEVDAALAKTYDNPILSSRPAGASLEGYIWGDTYEFYTTATPEDIISRALTEFESIISRNNLESAFASRGLSLHEAITLASIIQKESYAPDMPQVAQVFLLRLERSIPLGSDAVIAYAADQENPDRDKTDMSYLTAFGCPWNSRTCTGLPPSPISNPGLSALESVANPASGEYLYFLTGDDGKMYYAYTEEEHLQNRVHCPELCKYL